jgi:phycoerythrobilin:ferredoxin oxidoreductase
MRNKETAASKIMITGSRLGASSSSSSASILSTNIINSEQSSSPPPPPPQPDVGLYRPFAELAWTMLTSSSTKYQQPLSLEPAPDVPESLRHQMAVAKGPQSQQGGSSSSSSSSVRRVVHMETRALQAKNESYSVCPIQYARFALLETIPQQQQQEQKQPDGSSSEAVNNNNGNLDITAVAAAAPTAGAANSRVTVHTSGIQVLNLVIFPNPSTTNNNNKKNRRPLPVWGADFVSLPGNKHLLLLDAQPMRADCTHYRHWDAWHAKHNIGSHDDDSSSSLSSSFPWGGDLPPAVQKFVSPRALWTRMGAAAAAAAAPAPAADGASIPQQQDPVELIQGQLLEVFQEHLQLYLDLLLEHDEEDDADGGGENDEESDNKDNNNDINVNWSREYLQYRLDNDPARPMLKSLYGEEWTEQVLNTVLFPISKLVAPPQGKRD